ncbi:MAG: sigma 54-interacting transcriptional regulator [Bacillota bacterium]
MKGKRILIVQSDMDLSETIQQGLASTYNVLIAEDVPEALSILVRHQPDLILLDLVLPRGSGIHLLDYLLGRDGPVPPVILTGRHLPDPETNPFLHLIAAFLPKPFHLAQLRREVETVLQNWQPPPLLPSIQGNPQVLLAIADEAERTALLDGLQRAGAQVVPAGTVAEAASLVERERFDLVVCDWVMPDGTGRNLVERGRTVTDPPPVLVLSANTTPQFARRALTLGATDILPKPVSTDFLLVALEKVRFRSAPLFNTRKLAAATQASKEESARRVPGSGRMIHQVRYSADDIIGISPAIQRARLALQHIARMESTVLISGETGSGKELFAHALHQLSARRSGPFVPVNAAAIPEQLLESELFGYSSGAFTGAKKEGHRGKFQQANGGTLFLDEIGDLPLGLQAKLLRVLEEGEVQPVGGEAPQRVDVRLVVATHRNLGAMVRDGLFRSDLYFRLNVVNIPIPPLRERPEDIPLLAERFLQDLCDRYDVPPKRFSLDAMDLLRSYSWPGNVRELRNTVEHAFVFTPGDTIYPANLPGELLQSSRQPREPAGMALAPGLSEPEAILRALEQTQGNKVKAARLLGISRAGLYNKLKQYGLG